MLKVVKVIVKTSSDHGRENKLRAVGTMREATWLSSQSVMERSRERWPRSLLGSRSALGVGQAVHRGPTEITTISLRKQRNGERCDPLAGLGLPASSPCVFSSRPNETC